MNFNQAPLFKLVIPFIAGILGYIFISNSLPFPYISTIVAGCSILILHLIKQLNKYKFTWVYSISLFFCFLLLGYSATKIATTTNNSNHYAHFLNEEQQVFYVKLLEEPIEKEKSVKIVGEIAQIDSIKSCGKIILYLQKDVKSEHLHYGDVLSTKTTLTEIKEPKNEAEFDYKKFLKYHQIHHQNYIKSSNWTATGINLGNIFFKTAFRFRKKLHAIFIDNGLKNNELGVASALILGIRDNLEKDLLTAYSNTGATHVLAVSGLHVGIIYIILNKLLLFLSKYKKGKILKAVIILIVLWFYALITGLSPSVLRAATMFSFIIVAQTTFRNTNIYNTLAASALLLLTINPYLIMEIGFQLSYLAVLGIVYIQPKLYAKWTFENRLLDNIWQLSTVSIAAQLATFPLGLYYFHQFPNYFLLSNLIVIPLATVIVYSGIIIFVTSIVPLISGFLTYLLDWIIGFMNFAINLLGNLPLSTTSGVDISIFETLCIYVIIVLFLLNVRLKKANSLIVLLVFIMILTVTNTHQKFMEGNQKQLTIYNIPKVTAIDFISGNQNIFYTDTGLTSDKIKFHINNFRIQKNLATTKTNFSNTSFTNEYFFQTGNFIQFFDKRIFLLNSPFDLFKLKAQKIKLDYLIYASVSLINMEKLNEYFEFDQLIISSAVPDKIALKLQNNFQENKIITLNVTNEGMLQFKY